VTDDPFDRIGEFDRLYGGVAKRERFGEGGTATVAAPGSELGFGLLDGLMAAMDRIMRPEERIFDLPMVDLVMPDMKEDLYRFRLETMFPPVIHHAPFVGRLYDFDPPRRSFRDEFWDTMKFFSMLRPLRQRGKKRAKRFKVAAAKRRNGWRRHLKNGKRS